mmetsp:Transcript_50548/g.114819  ORF Transcript_50548/g.114819 Transcript_50548/m.114819 type:complete len:510 (-) Transcript_50548:47-1576(-)
MFCAISGEVPTEPVVSTKTGHLFEKKLISKYLASEDKCPVTGEPLSEADLLPLQAGQTARPRPITATSIPGLLSHFQNEWDAVMLETYTLKQHLDATRKELSQVLYQHDAACRVIARLSRERDEARAMLGARQSQVADFQAHVVATGQAAGSGVGAVGAEGMDLDPSAAAAAAGITSAVLSAMAAKGKELSKGRKKRAIPATLASAQDVKTYTEKSSASPHSSKSPALLCVDLHPSNPLVTLTGGADKTAVLFDHAKGQVAGTLAGHDKKVTCAKFLGDGSAVTGSADKTVKIWSSGGGGWGAEASATIGGLAGEVTGLSVHPTGDYLVTAGKDGTWALCSIAYHAVLHKESGSSGYNCVSFHPDGLLLGLGSANNAAEIWDMKTQKKIHAFEDHGGAVNALDFSENGYLMASAAQDGKVSLWDLRKLAEKLKVTALPGDKPAHSVRFDYSGVFLATGGASVQVMAVKEWEPVAALEGHAKDVTGLCFNRDATSLASCSVDRTVRLWGK